MPKIAELYQTADWKSEKHVPVIALKGDIKPGEFFKIKVQVGQEIAHPNTLEHHIKWIDVFFLPEGAKFPVHIARNEFTVHGEADAVTEPFVKVKFKTAKPGTVIATSYCNIHGLWTNEVSVEF